MKRKIMAVFAAASVAAATLATSVYADNSDIFSGCIEKLEDGTWKLTQKGIDLVREDAAADGANYCVHIAASEETEEMFTFEFASYINEKDYVGSFNKYDTEHEKTADFYYSLDELFYSWFKDENEPLEEYGIFDFSESPVSVEKVEIIENDGFVGEYQYTDLKDIYQNSFSKVNDGEWEFNEYGLAILGWDKYAGGVYDLHLTLDEEPEDSMILNFSFTAGKKTYEAMYIAMKPEQDMKIPVKDIRQMLDEKYADEEIPYDKFDSGRIIDSQDHISVLEYTESENIDYPSGSIGDFVFDGVSTFTLTGVQETLADANATAGGNTGIAVHVRGSLTDGYNVVFTFTDSEGNTVPVVFDGKAQDESDTLFVKVRGLIEESGISAGDITGLTVTGGDISYIEINSGDSDYY
ncbi:MAG: hypothetical protein J6X60_10775 [Ruminiclostridium sp.]|nr:hypothetical protein [Ruminiclostridium sp.]